MAKIQPVILCGGSGTRLWPRSRADKPKPFLPLIGAQSLFEKTVARCGDTTSYAPALVVTGAKHFDHVRAQAPNASVIVEPMGRNTAPAIALAALRLDREVPMLVCPSDHHIEDEAAFHAAINTGLALARDGRLVTFGIAPDRPETGYGYIERGAALGGGYEVARFVEKPDAVRAQQFLDDGRFSWNGGLFLFTAGAFLDELARLRPEMFAQLEQAVEAGKGEGAAFYPDAAAFEAVTGESIDYAVMENTDCAAMVEVDMGWSDIGSWPALHAVRSGDGDGNSVNGPAEMLECKNVLVESDGPRVSAIGLEDVIIVVDGDEVLVVHADHAQAVGTLKGAREQ